MRRSMIHHASSSFRSLGDRATETSVRALPFLIAATLAAPQAVLAFTTSEGLHQAVLPFSGVDPLHPLGAVSIEGIIGRVITVILGLLGSISLLMFVYGGITWMTAQGNEEKIKKAKNTIVYSIFGLFIAFGAYEILRVLFNEVIGPAAFTSAATQ